MKRSCIGKLEVDTTRSIFICDKPFSQMRQNEVRAYANLDLLQTKASFTDEVDSIYNEMDIYFCVACLCSQFGHDNTLLEKVSYYFFNKVNDCSFYKQYESLDERNTSINMIIEDIINDCINNNSVDTNITPVQSEWWKNNVIDLNYYCVDFEKSNNISTDIAIAGVSDYVTLFKECADVYCYTECDVNKLSTRAKRKRDGLLKLRRFLDYSNVNLDHGTQSIYIQSKIMETTDGHGADFEVECLRYMAKKKNNVSNPVQIIAIVVSIIVTLAPVATAIVGLIAQSRQAKDAEIQNAVNEANRYMPDTSDFFSILDSDNDGSIDLKWILAGIGLLGIAYYYS